MLWYTVVEVALRFYLIKMVLKIHSGSFKSLYYFLGWLTKKLNISGKF